MECRRACGVAARLLRAAVLIRSIAVAVRVFVLRLRRCGTKRGQHFHWPPKTSHNLRYLLQPSLTIFRLATRISPYSSLFEAFSTSPAFFSFFSSAFDSGLAEPVTVTLWPRCSSSLTLLLFKPQTVPSSPLIENSPGSSP